MSYKNDSMLVLANKYGKASADAKAQLWETYDKIRDLTVSGSAIDGSGFGFAGKALLNIARLIAPTSFMPILGNNIMDVPGTSFFSSISGGTGITSGGQAAFGMSNISKYPGYPSGGAASITSATGLLSSISSAVGTLGSSLMSGIGNLGTSLANDFTVGGIPTGGASALNAVSPMAGAVTGVATAAGSKSSITIPVAGVLAGVGGLMSSLSPYFGPFGIAAGLTANLLTGWSGAVLAGYQSVNAKIINNADTILASKVKNIETVCKQLDAQGDIIRKMLKDGADADKKAIESLS